MDLEFIDEGWMHDILRDFKVKGFSYLRLPIGLVSEALSLAEFFYNLNISDRLSMLASDRTGVLGYCPSELEAKEVMEAGDKIITTLHGSRSRGYSSFDFIEERSIYLGAYALFRENAWIDRVPRFQERALALYEDFKFLSRSLSSSLIKALEAEDQIVSHDISQICDEDCLSLMRILRYRADESLDVSKPHTDYEFLAVVVATCEGLQVMDFSGEWQVVPNITGHAIIVPGDMFEVISRGYIRSAFHRTKCGGRERKAVIFFQGLPMDFRIHYPRLGDMAPRTFGEHILSMLLRGSAHLAPQAELLSKQMKITPRVINPFRY